MPHKHEKPEHRFVIPKEPGKDKRIKLTDKQRLWIKLNPLKLSQRKLAFIFGVSRRLISFIHSPDALEENKKRRDERGGWRQYYTPKSHRNAMKKHRHYKKSLAEQGQ